MIFAYVCASFKATDLILNANVPLVTTPVLSQSGKHYIFKEQFLSGEYSPFSYC